MCLTGYVKYICIKIWNIFIDEMCLTSSVKCKNIFVMKTEGIKDMGWSKVSNQTEQSWHNLEFISASSGAGLRNPNASFWTHMAMWSQLDWRSLDSSNLQVNKCINKHYIPRMVVSNFYQQIGCSAPGRAHPNSSPTDHMAFSDLYPPYEHILKITDCMVVYQQRPITI